ncbi:MAG: WYL domain-containing protein [Gemmatimonadales bacterium]|nr:WYL domain-containing protein [Gemmatimonadales bacterium]
MSTAEQLTRIVQMVAELGRRERCGDEPATLAQVAAAFGVTEKAIAADLRTLTALGEHSADDWLLSLSAWQQDDRLSISSGGPFRRPLLLTPMERCALQIALAGDPAGAKLAKRLDAVLDGAKLPAAADESSDAMHWVVTQAARNRRRIELDYAGEGEATPRTWTLDPHQIIDYHDRVYVVAWTAEGWRHFRLDRAVAVRPTDLSFEFRKDFREVVEHADLLRAATDQVDTVTVRFAPGVARWIRARYPAHQNVEDGSVEVELVVTNEAWLVRRVLDHGIDAEVVRPAHYRAAVRRALA